MCPRSGGGRMRGSRGRRARSPEHDETADRIKRHGLWWSKGERWTVDPMVSSGHGYRDRPKLHLHNYTEATPLKFFESALPNTISEIDVAATLTGKVGVRHSFEVSTTDIWLFLGLKYYMMIFNMDGDKGLYWTTSAEGQPVVMGAIGGHHNPSLWANKRADLCAMELTMVPIDLLRYFTT